MLYFLLIWMILAIASLVIGTGLLASLGVVPLKRLGDRVIVSLWIGLLCLGVSYLALALGIPLSPGVGLATLGGLSLLSLSHPQSRAMLRDLWAQATLGRSLGVLGLALLAAMFTTQKVTWPESAWYHYGASRWLGEQGAVYGLVLILKNLGITSIWFALNAPFNHAGVEFRAGAVLNGFIGVLALLHMWVSLSHIRDRTAHLSDWFITVFYSLLLLYTVISQEMQLIIASPSPDWPIVLLIGVGAWSLLVSTDRTLSPHPASHQISATLMPLILATGAITIKLSALPLWGITLLTYGIAARKHIGHQYWRHAVLAGGVLVCCLVPLSIVGVRLSGCPFYPAPYFCLDVPWTLPSSEIQHFASETHSLREWFGDAPSGQSPYLWLFWQWLSSAPLNRVMFALILLSLGSAIYLVWLFRFGTTLGQVALLLLGLGGTAFISRAGPLIRFALGYLLVLPTLAIVLTGQKNSPPSMAQFVGHSISLLSDLAHRWRLSRRLPPLLVAVLITIGIILPVLRQRLGLPPALQSIPLESRQINDVTYYRPSEKASCWASPLPCTRWDMELTDIQLREPQRGIRGGFVQTVTF